MLSPRRLRTLYVLVFVALASALCACPSRRKAAPPAPARPTPSPAPRQQVTLRPGAPPALRREFRGVWIPTVYNLAWPSRAGLPAAEQKRQLIALLDRIAAHKLNAIIFQIRSMADALYPSTREPWSPVLSGRMARPPQPPYDPLAFAIAQAHRRGLALHAWFNPFRAGYRSRHFRRSANHITRTHPQLTRRYGNYFWLDPSAPQARAHVRSVILDVVRRYDIDGIHFDDYFYPYPRRTSTGRRLPFPDQRNWRIYRRRGGRKTRAQWRRAHVDGFVRRTYRAVKRLKPWVKVGISPFGIWRPNHPRGIRGLDAYNALYADARRWLQEGWLDYCSPQLYWSTRSRRTSYTRLLRWWQRQNTRRRHLWPGLHTLRFGTPQRQRQVRTQIHLARQGAPAAGHIHWDIRGLRPSLLRSLTRHSYAHDALVPAFPWLSRQLPAAPSLHHTPGKSRTLSLSWRPPPGQHPTRWILQTKTAQGWRTTLLPRHRRRWTLTWKQKAQTPLRFALSYTNRYHQQSTSAHTTP